MKTVDENEKQSTIEIVKKCSKCGEEYSINFTPRRTEDWRVVADNIGTEGVCPKCAYSSKEIEFLIDGVNSTCGKVSCTGQCYDKSEAKDHCMRGMLCVHCGKTFCLRY